MFDLLASKLEEATAFADGLAGLDALSMDRLRDDQERVERSKDESLRLLRSSGDTREVASTQDSRSEGGAAERERTGSSATSNSFRKDSSGSNAFADIEMPRMRTEAEHRAFLSSPTGFGGEDGKALGTSARLTDDSFKFASTEDDGNFDDEFDPILASIRKPPQQDTAAPAPAAPAVAGKAHPAAPSPFLRRGEKGDGIVGGNGDSDRGTPDAATTFAAGLLSMFPGDMRARAGDMMAQSSARISKSANAFRSSLETGRPPGTDAAKRRQSDRQRPESAAALEEGRGTKGAAGRRTVGMGGGEEDDVRILNVNELLSENERQQLAAFSSGSGAAGGTCGWRRLRKFSPIFVGIALVGAFYLWRWTALTVAPAGNPVIGIDAEGS